VQAAIDTYDEQSSEGVSLPYMQRRSAVLELLAHGQLLFVLANSGLCSVFSMSGEALQQEFVKEPGYVPWESVKGAGAGASTKHELPYTCRVLDAPCPDAEQLAAAVCC
jgi:hypothetical protein